MTDREAIEALKHINLTRVHPFYSWEEMGEVRDIAIFALKEREERNKGCEYCDTDKYKHPLGFHSTKELDFGLCIKDGALYAERYDEPDSLAEIDFCPMCGRPLK